MKRVCLKYLRWSRVIYVDVQVAQQCPLKGRVAERCTFIPVFLRAILFLDSCDPVLCCATDEASLEIDRAAVGLTRHDGPQNPPDN